MTTNTHPETNLLALTDCLYFTNGSCAFKGKCHYRHCQAAIKQLEKCPKWPESCRNVTCPYRHPTNSNKLGKKNQPIAQALVNHPCQPEPPAMRQRGLIAFFWDIENVPVPKGQRPFDIVQRIRQKLVIETGLQEIDFSCYCNSTTIPPENQQSLHHATVRIVHVPDRKPGAVDRQIMLDLDRFERIHRPPATIVLISGDIDFVGKLSDLRHQARFHVIVIHNKPAKEELKATVHEHYPWELFTESSPKPLMEPTTTNSRGRVTNSPANFQSVSNDRLNNDNNRISTVSEKSQPPVIIPLLHSHDQNTAVSINQSQSKPPTSHRRAGSVTRKHHPTDDIQALKPLMDISLNQASTSNIGSNTPPLVSTPTVVPRFRMRQEKNTTQLNRQNISISGSCDQISSTVEDKTEKVPPPLLQCPHCTNEFTTIKALRQHQQDKNHLFNCSICKEGFPTAIGLKQHQSAKGHNVINDTNDHCDTQLDTTVNLNIQQFSTGYEHNLDTPVKNKCRPVLRNPVANHSTINGGINNID